MSCSARTIAGTAVEPPEFCDNDADGEFCTEHQLDEPDPDAAYDRLREDALWP